MPRDNWDICRELEILQSTVLRLEERFRLEKDEALEKGTGNSLLEFQESSRTFYQPRLSRLIMDLSRLVAETEPDRPGSGVAERMSTELNRLTKKMMSRFVGTPHRLLRNAEFIEERVGTRSDRVEPSRPAREKPSEGEEEDLVETDPPVECPRCGTVLLHDADFTMLICPGCGAREEV
ncbi:hypothetical protein GF402_08650 [Candidatus Fermentibacteria bacterium]|nr:hypothetical protein [Candidatus Fermentibacteria bacterium]